MSMTQAIQALKDKQDLSAADMQSLFARIFKTDINDDTIREFLIALNAKGETHQEILGAVQFLKQNGSRLQCESQDLIDCCGTGGDQKNTFNISTAVSFVLAGAGCHVAKHGNRAISSKSGSADILSALGIDIQAPAETMRQAIDQIGIGFLFAPQFYPLMKRVGAIRKSIPHRTIFNVLGPLLNPAGAQRQLMGVFEKRLTLIMAQVLKELGSTEALIVHSDNGMDEFSLSCLNHVTHLKEGQIKSFTFDPRESGYAYCDEAELLGGDCDENAARLKQCLKGHSLALDHTVHINAAWGLVVAGKAASFMDGLLLAQDSISSGSAYQALVALVKTAGRK